MSLTLLIISLVSGLLTVLAPCVLPLLPVIIGGSLSKDKLRPPYLIITSLCLSIVIFTILLKTSVVSLGLHPNTIKYFSAGLVLLLGIITLFPQIWDKLSFKLGLSQGSNQLLEKANTKSGAVKDILTGISLGPVFSSCSPTYFLILATVLPQNFFNGLIALLVYSFGLSLSLFAISILGQKLVKKLKWAANPHGNFKKVIGVIFILVSIAIFTGFDKKIEAKILDSGFFDVTQFENQLLEKTEPMPEEESSSPEASNPNLQSYTEIKGPTDYLNTDEEFLLQDLVGEKVVLVNFMTYECINCQRTFPYTNDWYEKYQDQGLEIVGIHTPEFNHEKNINNVEAALERFDIQFPVVLDNNKETWRAYQNRFWPRRYIIDKDGYVVYDHIGEGEYEETEKVIQEELARLN